MPPQDRVLVKDANIEMISMNLKEGGCCVVNRDEDLTAVDFESDVSLVEKEAAVLSTGAPQEKESSSRWLLLKWNTSVSYRRVEPGGLHGIDNDMEKKRGWWGGACGVIEGSIGGRDDRATAGGSCWEGMQLIAGAGGYISEGKEWLVGDQIR
ncbi:hypothetical protein BHE74_00050333 [Ensete ventricosum]|nr:hypothetical protein BHE74_00050333 [Ensete ventricosum]